MSLRNALRPRNVFDYTRALVDTGECKLALDIGCGNSSPLSALRPKISTIGVDAYPEAIEIARKKGLHDHYVVADILKEDPESILKQAQISGKCDIVSLYGVIEHVPKRQGYDLLERCERLTSKYIILETPHGFVEQGPEFGNEFQRHLSGWFIQDFEGLGYKVYGATGTHYLRGYMAGPKYSFPGCIMFDEILTLLLRINAHPRHAFNLIAIKDVRGTPARHGVEMQNMAERKG
jgi:2-polyprenyl-3-methyl-5-hydroxy-6-metoxy-1,4-benzoquinol methylase